MPAIVTDDGVRLYAEEAGQGEPLLFVHEFAGDHRSWEPQMRFFSAAYRCVTYAARGYPPSDVPTDPGAYSQERAVADAIAVLDGLEIGRAHVVGLSMGGFTALHLTLRHPARVASAVVAGAGYGAQPERSEAFRAECEAIAAAFETEGAQRVADRVPFSDLRGALGGERGRGQHGLGPEGFGALGLGAVAGPCYHRRTYPLRVLEYQVQGGEAAHRQADHVRPANPEAVEHRDRIRDRALL